MLWRSGDANMIIYDVYENKSDEVIPKFWIYQEEIIKPISAIASADANKILGIGISKSKSAIIHYYERNDQKITLMSEVDRRAIDPLSRSIIIKVSL